MSSLYTEKSPKHTSPELLRVPWIIHDTVHDIHRHKWKSIPVTVNVHKFHSRKLKQCSMSS